jgi:hypothetical protein
VPVIVSAEMAGSDAFAAHRARRPRRSIVKIDGSSAGSGEAASVEVGRAGAGIARES